MKISKITFLVMAIILIFAMVVSGGLNSGGYDQQHGAGSGSPGGAPGSVQCNVAGSFGPCTNTNDSNQVLASSYPSLTAADGVAIALGRQLVVDTNETLTANTTLLSPVVIIPGGGFTKASSYTLTVVNSFQAGDFQVFTGFSGNDVILENASYIRAEWFGVTGTADDVPINTAILCASVGPHQVQLLGKVYVTSNSVSMLSYVALKGSSMEGSSIKVTGTYNAVSWTGGTKKAFLSDVYIWPGGTGTGGTGLYMNNAFYNGVDRVWTDPGLAIGANLTSNAYSNTFRDDVFAATTTALIIGNGGNANVFIGCNELSAVTDVLIEDLGNTAPSKAVSFIGGAIQSFGLYGIRMIGSANAPNRSIGLQNVDFENATGTFISIEGNAASSSTGINLLGNYIHMTVGAAWVSGNNYAVGKQVSYSSHNYLCIQAVTNSTTPPNSDTTDFQLSDPVGLNVSAGTGINVDSANVFEDQNLSNSTHIQVAAGSSVTLASGMYHQGTGTYYNLSSGATIFGRGMPEELTFIFNSSSGIALNAVSNVVHRDYAIMSIVQSTVWCGSGDATPIVVDILGAAYSNGSALPSASLCTSGTKPTGNGASQYGNQAAWTCPTTATAANYDFVAKVVTAPMSSTNCSVTLEVLRY